MIERFLKLTPVPENENMRIVPAQNPARIRFAAQSDPAAAIGFGEAGYFDHVLILGDDGQADFLEPASFLHPVQ
jgi:hypothetical protein